MKHPALTRIFAVVLTILCLVMLLAGIGSAVGAVRTHRSRQQELQRLTDRAEEYKNTLAALAGAEDYAHMNRRLQQRQEDYETAAAKHRTELALYTATRSGVRQGEAALRQATAALNQGKAQYEEGLALFEEQEAAFQEGYEQFLEGKRQLAEGRKTLELAGMALGGLRSQLEQMKRLAATLESEDPDARRELSLAAYDGLLSILDQSSAFFSTLKEQGGIQPEQMRQLAQMLAQQTQADAELTEQLSRIEWRGVSAQELQQLEDGIAAVTGLSMEQIRSQVRQQRDAIAATDDQEPMSEEQFLALQAAYLLRREQIGAIGKALETRLGEWESQYAQAKGQMDAAQAQIDEMDAFMEQGKEGIDQGRQALDQVGEQIKQGEAALNSGWGQIWQQKKQLEEKAEELRVEKESLDAQAEELRLESQRVENRKTLEQRETSLRLTLLGNEEIQNRVEGGMELSQAAENCKDALAQDSERDFRGRIRVCLLMFAGTAAGSFGIPGAFEKTRSRIWLILPVCLCLGCAAGAELLCRLLGRGDSYSALAVAGFAFLQLLTVLPRKKE